MKKMVFLVLIFIFTGIIAVSAATTKTLETDTKLHPIGWLVGDDYVTFKAGTTVILNEFGEVIEGTLASQTKLRPVGWRRVSYSYNNNAFSNDALGAGYLMYQRNTVVSFNDRGEVIAGIIDYDSMIFLTPNNQGKVLFKPDAILRFNENGAVVEGTIRNDTLLRPNDWQKMTNNSDARFIKFKGGTNLKFNDKGEVLEGTVKNETKISLVDGTTKTYLAGTVVKFNDITEKLL